jgi:small-conductance mechanosensitive channel
MPELDRSITALGLEPALVWRVVASLAVLAVWIAVLRIGRRLLVRTVDDEASRFQMMRVGTYAVGFVALLVVARIWIQGIAGVATYLGLLSAGIAIALQDPIANLVGWLFIIIRRPFKIGDRIQMATHIGDVVDIRPFRFVMLEVGNWVDADQSTGRLLHVPNGLVFKNSVANFDEAFGYIWNEIEVVVTFESDWRKAKQALELIVSANAEVIEPAVRRRIAEQAEKLHIRFAKVTPVVWTSVVDNGVRLTMRYLCTARERRSSSSAIWERVLDAFAAMPDVDLAYPTTRFFDHTTEAKTMTSIGASHVERSRSSRPPS